MAHDNPVDGKVRANKSTKTQEASIALQDGSVVTAVLYTSPKGSGKSHITHTDAKGNEKLYVWDIGEVGLMTSRGVSDEIPAVTEAVQDALKQAFKNGKMSQEEATKIATTAKMIADAAADNNIDAKEQKNIVASTKKGRSF